MAWRVALERRDGPTALVLTRQNLPVLDRTVLGAAEGLLKGGYVLKDAPAAARTSSSWHRLGGGDRPGGRGHP